MEEIQKEQISCLFVVLSAYRDFEYAKHACDLGAYAYWSYVKKKYKLNVPNFHVPAGQVSLQEPQQILPLLSDILLRTD